ncbi:ovomucoid-like [Pituophis catenifer annectens]|uniref:ovomucoid-like n=1 Tax=Pituophis catenifer annectens TaxID=94852 RepID=UPI003991F6C4
MKPGSFLLLTLLLFFLYSDIAAQFNLEIYCCGYPKTSCDECPRFHCGSDGRTYNNKCDFCNAYVRSGKRLWLRHFGRC